MLTAYDCYKKATEISDIKSQKATDETILQIEKGITSYCEKGLFSFVFYFTAPTNPQVVKNIITYFKSLGFTIALPCINGSASNIEIGWRIENE